MKTQKTVTCTKTNRAFNLVEGTEYTFLKVFFYNGEHYYRLKDAAGKVDEVPSVFFTKPVTK